jgi:hypothetical protein
MHDEEPSAARLAGVECNWMGTKPTLDLTVPTQATPSQQHASKDSAERTPAFACAGPHYMSMCISDVVWGAAVRCNWLGFSKSLGRPQLCHYSTQKASMVSSTLAALSAQQHMKFASHKLSGLPAVRAVQPVLCWSVRRLQWLPCGCVPAQAWLPLLLQPTGRLCCCLGCCLQLELPPTHVSGQQRHQQHQRFSTNGGRALAPHDNKLEGWGQYATILKSHVLVR